MPLRLDRVPTVLTSIQWLRYVVRLTNRLGGPLRFAMTAERRPSFHKSATAKPREGAGVRIPGPAVSEMSVNVTLPLARRRSGQPSLSKSKNIVPHPRYWVLEPRPAG